LPGDETVEIQTGTWADGADMIFKRVSLTTLVTWDRSASEFMDTCPKEVELFRRADIEKLEARIDILEQSVVDYEAQLCGYKESI
jgi:polyhydroxyalkanoate synthesis regulator phasin